MMKNYRRVVLSLLGNHIFHHLNLTTFSEKQTPQSASKHPHVIKTGKSMAEKGCVHTSLYILYQNQSILEVFSHIFRKPACL